MTTTVTDTMNSPCPSCRLDRNDLTTTTLETALQWRALGIACIPTLAGSKRPALAWKRYQSEMPTVQKLKAWFGSGGYGLAVVTGWRGLAVVDWDKPAKMRAWVVSPLFPLSIQAAAATYKVRTRKGYHLYFFVAEPTHCWRGDGVDIKANGGYVLAPPTIHPSGHQYEAIGKPSDIRRIASIKDLLPDYELKPEPHSPVVSAVDNLDRAWRNTGGGSAYAQAALEGELDRLMQAKEGNRNHTLCRCAFVLGQLVAQGDLDRGIVELSLLNTAICIGLSDREALATIASGMAGGEANPR